MSSYRIAPIFLIRATGVPFENLERLGTTRSSKIARELLVRRAELVHAKREAEAFLANAGRALSAETSRAYRAALRTGVAGSTDTAPAEISAHTRIAGEIDTLMAALNETLRHELEAARSALLHASSVFLPGYLIFGAGEFRDRLHELSANASNGQLPPRNARARERERHLLLYLQRVCAKNDTFSEFGPSTWGTIVSAPNAPVFSPQPGVVQRTAFLERWTAHSLAAALNADPDVRAEMMPRLHPNGSLAGSHFRRGDTGEVISLSADARALAERCDGQTSAHSLGAADGLLSDLAARGVIRWECEVPALEPNAFDVLTHDIEHWRDSPLRDRWLERACAIADLPHAFPEERRREARQSIMAEARERLDDLGTKVAGPRRSLYAATNPIAEECSRAVEFVLSEAMTDRLVQDIEPWIDLWRDTYAFVASRVAGTLRGLLKSAPVHDGACSLPAFLRHCAANQLPLTGHGLVAPAHIAFQEVKAAFRKIAEAHAQAPEWLLTADDCAIVRRSFEYPKFDEFTYPSADLQISAKTPEEMIDGRGQWIVSELHPPVALLHHALYWSCPDKAALSDALARGVHGQPSALFGFFAADFTAHTTVRLIDAMPESATFVGEDRSHPKWRSVPPSEVEVFADENTGDVALRKRGSHEYLGSFARGWIIPLGFHPFHFGRAPHMPRLRCGDAIVQRRSWTVTREELLVGDTSGISADLVLAIEQLRAEKDWPRHIYIRPTEQALRRSGAEGRDKDTKPVFVDLESYLSLEIFYRWLKKSGELEVTEMLPDPDHLCWQETDGRRTFELRTLLVPLS
ncbi:MAG: lantibiotic dehydratase [Verrucomicrobiota bacterium]|nr:lantibiotic dehydratase [Verrucomicrobiota bacterium]